MRRITKRLGLVLGPSALLALGVACGPRPAPTSPTAPTSEQPGVSATPPSPRPGGPTGQVEGRPDEGQEEPYSQQGQPGQPPELSGQSPPSGLGSGLTPPQGTPGQAPSGAPGMSEAGQPGAANERALCDALANSARIRVEDIPNGFSIVVTPKSGVHLSTVRDTARRLESSMHLGPSSEGRSSRGDETCGIAELGRMPSMTTKVVEGSSVVRIQMTTSNAQEVKDLRRMARDEVNTLVKGSNKLH